MFGHTRMEPEKQQEPRGSLDIDDGYDLGKRKSELSITENRDDVESQRSEEENRQQTNQPPEKQEKDPNLVVWDGPDDPENPLNYPLWRKWVITMALAGTALWVTFASSIFASATVKAAMHFHVSLEVMTLGTSLMVLGYMIGPLIWGPFSELYGRKVPLFSGYFVFAVFQIPVAVAQNVETIMLCRFIQGVFGCSPLSIVGGALVDFWDPVGRGVAVSLFASATFLGPTLGPIV